MSEGTGKLYWPFDADKEATFRDNGALLKTYAQPQDAETFVKALVELTGLGWTFENARVKKHSAVLWFKKQPPVVETPATETGYDMDVETARKDWERSVYKQVDAEDAAELNDETPDGFHWHQLSEDVFVLREDIPGAMKADWQED